jgi:hypothetical protein
MGEAGKLLVALGVMITIVGLVLWLASEKLVDIAWFGHLPGDIRIERPGFSFYMPIATMLLLSLLVSALIWIVRLLLQR